MPWEYRVLTDPCEDDLNALGKDGWQLGLLSSREARTVCYLARPTGVDPQQAAHAMLKSLGHELGQAAKSLHVAAEALKNAGKVNTANAAHQAARRAETAAQGLSE